MRVMKLSKQAGRPVALLLAVSLLLIVAAVALPVGAQSQDPLELYDENDNGVIDADELTRAVDDYLQGRIDRDMMLRVYDLYLAENSLATGQTDGFWPDACDRYDTNDDDDEIDRGEVAAAIFDFNNSLITRPEVIDVINCYLFASVPTPTPTPVPSCVVESLGVLTAPFTRIRATSWDNTCESSELTDSYAKLYEFELRENTHVTIDARSLKRDSFITLVEDTLVVTDDDNGYPNHDRNSRIAGEFESGTYTVEVTLRESHSTGIFSLRIVGEKPIPLLGHQADFTSQYRVNAMVPTRVPNLIPAAYPDPGVVIPEAIPIAAREWNKAVGTPFPHILFCERAPTSPTLPHITPVPCENRNNRPYDDGDTTNVDVADGSTNRIVLFSFGIPNCGRSMACVKPDPVVLLTNLNPLGNGDMGSLKMVIEEPAWSYIPAGPFGLFGEHIRRLWTNDHLDHNRTITEGTLIYLPSVIMHEFGHTAGLEDLYKDEYNNKYQGYLMDDTHGFTSIPTLDKNYIKQVYLNEHGSEPHDK